MNKNFLYQLNGEKNGKLKFLLDNMQNEPRIAWHTSAGEDFRSLLYLSDNYQTLYLGQEIPATPDFFIFTDANSSLFKRLICRNEDEFPISKIELFLKDLVDIGAWYLYNDDRTTIKVIHYENLPDIYCPSNREIVMTQPEDKNFRRVIFLHVLIESNLLGSFKIPIIYVNSENESFCSRYVIGNTSFSHIVHVRYGGGIGGGGYASGAWLMNVLKKLNTEVFITDEHLDWQTGDKAALAKYANLQSEEKVDEYPNVYTVPSASWSGHGNVKWKLIQQQYYQQK